MWGLLSLALVSASSSVGSPSLVKLVEMIEPYVACRADSDRKIVELQQQLRSKQEASGSQELEADPTYHELKELNFHAEESCNLPKYVTAVAVAWGKSDSYDDWQSRKQAEFFIRDVVQAQWSMLSFQTGTYRFPLPVITAVPVVRDGTKNAPNK